MSLLIIGGMHMEKHYFAANNTSVGFYNYFNNIISPEEAERIYILKGGPGVGKSSFMKKFAKFLSELETPVEYIHCSTDYNSLDGIFVPEYKWLMVDGTSPHVVEPKFPGLVDEILDFAQYLDKEELKQHANEIKKVNKEKSRFYQSAYRYLEMAAIILNEINQIYDDLTDDNKKRLEVKKLISDLDELLVEKKETKNLKEHTKGKLRRLFSEAYTASGYISYINKLCKDKIVWEINSPNHDYIADLLDKIVNYVSLLDYDVEAYYMAIFPKKLQHIYIKELNLMIISFGTSSDKEEFKSRQSEIDELNKLYDLILEKAINSFKIAKEKHELLEKIYIKSMDFDKVDLLYKEIIFKLKKEIKTHKEE